MYVIKSGDKIVHHPMSASDICLSAKIVEELNTHGSLDMVIDDPTREKLACLDPIEVYDDDGMIWRGRVLNYDSGFIDTRINFHCEGALAYLCDVIVPPFTFRGQPDDSLDANDQPVLGMFHTLIDYYNAQLPQDDPRRFTVGRITVQDPNNYIFRSSESAMSVWEVIKTRLIDTLGGYVFLSGDNLDVINYMAGTSDWSDQTVEFGENLLNLVQAETADGLITRVIPYGAVIQEGTGHEEEPTGDGWHTWHGSRVHLTNPAYVENTAAKNKWGIIYGTNTWDDITETANLSTAATKYLQDVIINLLSSIDISAADLHQIDATTGKFHVLQYVHVICPSLQIDEMFLIVRKETDLIDVSQTKIAIGRPPIELSAIVGG